MTETVRFYFSFRSPYSWLAALEVSRKDWPIDLIPLVELPADTPPPNPASSPAKAAYIRQDVGRLVSRAGMGFKFPDPFDIDWRVAHLPFFYAKKQGRGFDYMLAAYSARWEHGLNLTDPDVISNTAESIGLSGQEAVAACSDADLKAEMMAAATEFLDVDLPFGVPFLVYRGETFWGQDRLWMLEERLSENA